MSPKLLGKVGVITGASKGIGASIALHMADEGAAVVVNYASGSEDAERVVTQIVGKGGKAKAVGADVAKQPDVARLFSEAKEAFAEADILVNNAGFYEFAPLEDITPEQFHKMFDLNVLGPMSWCWPIRPSGVCASTCLGHPTDWISPSPKDVYDFVVVGGGPCGMNAAMIAENAGHSVAVAERNLVGGTCVGFGCTPSKALLRAARAVYQARDGEEFGYTLGAAPRVDFAAAMTRVMEMRTFSSSLGSVAVAAQAGVDVFLGDARFVGRDTGRCSSCGDGPRARGDSISSCLRPTNADRGDFP